MIYRFLTLLCLCLTLSACAETELFSHMYKSLPGADKKQTQGAFKVGNPYTVDGQWYVPQEDYRLVETGIASWYGNEFKGRKTANGEIFDPNELTAAHRTLQMPSLVRVTNLENGKSVVVRINDRGPFKRGRIIDLSRRGAELLDFKGKGVARVKLEVLEQESRQVAQLARSGKSTKGSELAVNQGVRLGSLESASAAPTAPVQSASLEPVSRQVLGQPMTLQSPVPRTAPVSGHVREGLFYPDPVVGQQAARATTLYVQAGAFTVEDNAIAFAQKLQSLGQARVVPAQIGGRQFYRVRIPAADVAEADRILNRLVGESDTQALIVVE